MILHSKRVIAHRHLTLAALAWVASGSLSLPDAHAFAEVAQGEILLNIDTRVTSDSNVFGNITEQDDTVFSVEPSLAYTRRRGRMTVEANAGVRVNRFSDFDAEDSNDRFFRTEMTLPTAQGSPLTGSFYVDYFKGRRIDVYLTDRIDVNDLSVGGEGSYHFSSRTELRFGADALRSSPSGGPDNRSRSVKVGLGYGFRPKATLYADYRIRRSTSDRDIVSGFEIDQTDHAILVGVNGQLGPVLSGHAAFGFQSTSAGVRDGGGDSDEFVADAALEWRVRQRTELYLNVSADSRITNNAQTVDRTAISVGIKQAIARSFSFDGRLEWEAFDFRGTPSRSDDQFSAHGAIVYSATKYFSAGFELTYWERDPELAKRFDRTTFALFGTFRY